MAKAEKVKKLGRKERPQYPKYIPYPSGEKDKNGFPLTILVNDETEEKNAAGGKKKQAGGSWA